MWLKNEPCFYFPYQWLEGFGQGRPVGKTVYFRTNRSWPSNQIDPTYPSWSQIKFLLVSFKVHQGFWVINQFFPFKCKDFPNTTSPFTSWPTPHSWDNHQIGICPDFSLFSIRPTKVSCKEIMESLMIISRQCIYFSAPTNQIIVRI